MDRIQKLTERVKDLENNKVIVIREYSKDKPKLASALYFVGFTGIFITGWLLGLHWGWLVAIGVIAVSVCVSIAEDDHVL